jgi:GTPase SAR1 family protein
MKLILQGPPGSGKTTLANVIIGDKTDGLLHPGETKLEEALIACREDGWIANLDNWRLTPSVIATLEQIDCNLVCTTRYEVPETSIPVFRLGKLGVRSYTRQVLR